MGSDTTGTAPDVTSEGETSTGDADSSSSGSGPEPFDPFAGAELVVLEPLQGNLAFGDYDGDGDDDIISSYHLDVPLIGGFDRLAIYGLDREKGVIFGIRHQDIGFVTTPHPGHVDANASLDVVGAGSASVVQLGTVDGEFEMGPAFELQGALVGPILDLDGDGRIELVERDSGLRIRGADGKGGWAAEAVLDDESDCADPRGQWADLDGDDDLDLVTIAECERGGRVTTFLQDDGNFPVAHMSTPGFVPSSHELADVDDDGAIDLLASSYVDTPDTHAVAAVYPGHGDGTFGEALVELSVEQYGSISGRTADFDGNGFPELYLPTYFLFPESAASWVLVRVVDGEIVTHEVPFDVSPSYAADLDGNGCQDLVGDVDSQHVVLLSGCVTGSR